VDPVSKALADLFCYVLALTAVAVDIAGLADDDSLAAACIKDDECFCRWVETMVEEFSLNHEEKAVEALRRFMNKCFG